MHKQQLYTLSEIDYRLPAFLDCSNRVITKPANDIPMIRWPSGRWCVDANIYMLELYERNLSRKFGGGTLKSYAANISHLIRWCYHNKTDFIDLTDSQFSLFVRGLMGETRPKQPDVRVRNANAVIAIGRNCLDFLSCVGRFHDQADLVNRRGQIQGEEKEFEIKVEGKFHKKSLLKKYWHHRCFPTPDAKVKRLPVSNDTIKKLRQATSKIDSSFYLRRRRQIMLMMLEQTGGRRAELANLTVESVQKANTMNEPMLELITVKKKASETRLIPIHSVELAELMSFINKHRRQVIRKTVGLQQDHGLVFISETTGKPLRAQTISQEVYFLAKSSGIDEKTCSHMFRHRFITKLFVALIEQHDFENEDNFRRALLDAETMKQKVQQWTGHASLSSLDPYIHLAFDEASHFSKTYNSVSLSRVIEGMTSKVDNLKLEIQNKCIPLPEAIREFETILDLFNQDISLMTKKAAHKK